MPVEFRTRIRIQMDPVSEPSYPQAESQPRREQATAWHNPESPGRPRRLGPTAWERNKLDFDCDSEGPVWHIYAATSRHASSARTGSPPRIDVQGYLHWSALASDFLKLVCGLESLRHGARSSHGRGPVAARTRLGNPNERLEKKCLRRAPIAVHHSTKWMMMDIEHRHTS
jgi:hypothetical protein